MGEIVSKRFDEPDEVLSLPKLSGQIVVLGELYVGRYVHEPGWHWSVDIKPVIGTPSCQAHHQGFVVSGHIEITSDEGGQRIFGPGDLFDVAPGHDARVLGDEPCVTIDFRGARDWARPRVSGERILVTLLFTDIVGSTSLAARLGDVDWKELLSRHYERVRLELDRFRGYEVKTTGDGFLAMFDGAARAVQCAAAIAKVARKDGIEVRAGIHTGEVERHTDTIHGVAVHVAARVAALAGAGEVLISAPTFALLEGSTLEFSEAGEHELKGLQGLRRLYRLVEEALAPEGEAA